MTARTTVHGLQVADELFRFIEDQVLPGTGMEVARTIGGREYFEAANAASRNSDTSGPSAANCCGNAYMRARRSGSRSS